MTSGAMIRATLVFAACVAFAAPVAAAQLIVNGGFETGDFTGWARSGAAGSTGVNGNQPYSGDFAAFFSPNQDGSIAQTFNTLAGKTYTISFQLSHELGTAAPLNTFGVSFGGVSLGQFANFGNYTYHLISYVRPGAGPKELKFTFKDSRPTNFYLDDVSVLGPIPEPQTWMMLLVGFGLTGFAIRRRRAAVATIAA